MHDKMRRTKTGLNQTKGKQFQELDNYSAISCLPDQDVNFSPIFINFNQAVFSTFEFTKAQMIAL